MYNDSLFKSNILCFYRDPCWTIFFPQEKKYSLWQSEKECKFPPTLSKKSKNKKKIIPVLFPYYHLSLLQDGKKNYHNFFNQNVFCTR